MSNPTSPSSSIPSLKIPIPPKSEGNSPVRHANISTINSINLTIPSQNSSKISQLLSPQHRRNTQETKVMSSGSATGNPRNKCALKPGHSLMDWIRLGTSGIDLAGTKGIIKAISYAELAQHCTKDDAWIAIRGKVFNVTRYLEFHPGGPDELMQGVGKDATKLFDEIHAWVNYEQLLAKCFVGPLRNVVKVDLEPMRPRQKSTTPTPDTANKYFDRQDSGDDFKIPNLPKRLSNSEKTSPVKIVDDDDNELQMENNSSFLLPTAAAASTSSSASSAGKKGIVPRFDWIQKSAELALIFYTKPFCNPGVIVVYKSPNEITVKLLIEYQTHLYNFQFQNAIDWPCVARVARETGKIEVICIKMKSELWTAYGQMDKEIIRTIYDESWSNNEVINDNFYAFEIDQCVAINHDSYALALKPQNNNIVMIIPIGYHVSVTALVNDEFVTRSYTPVPVSYLPFACLSTNVTMLLKSYSTGILAKHLTTMKKSNQLAATAAANTLKLSTPKGNFQLMKLLEHNRFGMLAAGSGLTPILGALDHLLARINNKVEHIEMMFFNKTEEDIWCRDKLDTIAKKDNRFTIRHILSRDVPNWTGETGRICEEILLPLHDSKSESYVKFLCICGPKPFNDLAKKLLMEIGFMEEQLHIFKG